MNREWMQEIEAMREQLAARRRDFHRHPETGWMEMRTSSIIAECMQDLGFDDVLTGEDVCRADARRGLPSDDLLKQWYEFVSREEGVNSEFLPRTRNGMTGVIGILRCGSGPTMALRFDIDALPVQEPREEGHFPSDHGFASEHSGMMHACGHDIHMTIGLGTAAFLAKHRKELHGTLKMIFQPAEEGVRGASALVEAGHLNDVDYLLGSHIAGEALNSECSIGLGKWTSLATIKLDADFSGKAAHAGKNPEEGNNALLAAATAVLNLQAIPRVGGVMTRVNAGKLIAGSGRNIVCDRAHLELEVRGSTSEANRYMETYARRILSSAAQMHGCHVKVSCEGSSPAGRNDMSFVREIEDILREDTDLNVEPLANGRKLVSEDYACLAEAVQSHGGKSCFFLNNVPVVESLHSDHFNPDERSLVNGVKAFSSITMELLGRRAELMDGTGGNA